MKIWPLILFLILACAHHDRDDFPERSLATVERELSWVEVMDSDGTGLRLDHPSAGRLVFFYQGRPYNPAGSVSRAETMLEFRVNRCPTKTNLIRLTTTKKRKVVPVGTVHFFKEEKCRAQVRFRTKFIHDDSLFREQE